MNSQKYSNVFCNLDFVHTMISNAWKGPQLNILQRNIQSISQESHEHVMSNEHANFRLFYILTSIAKVKPQLRSNILHGENATAQVSDVAHESLV